jgi:hypothetical protein
MVWYSTSPLSGITVVFEIKSDASCLALPLPINSGLDKSSMRVIWLIHSSSPGSVSMRLFKKFMRKFESGAETSSFIPFTIPLRPPLFLIDYAVFRVDMRQAATILLRRIVAVFETLRPGSKAPLKYRLPYQGKTSPSPASGN